MVRLRLKNVYSIGTRLIYLQEAKTGHLDAVAAEVLVVDEVDEGHEVVLVDVRQEQEGLVALGQDVRQEVAARREDGAVERHPADGVVAAEDVKICNEQLEFTEMAVIAFPLGLKNK